MKRAKYGLGERLDTALGSLFLFYLAGAVGFLEKPVEPEDLERAIKKKLGNG